MKKLFLLSFLFFVAFTSYGKTINLDDALRFEPTDKYNEVSVPGARWTANHKRGNSFVMIKSYNADLENETRNYYMNVLDTAVFNLKGAELLQRKEEHWLDWQKNHLYKYYKTSDGKNVVTFNFTSIYYPYSVLCYYETDEELADFIELTECFKEPTPKGVGQLVMVLKNAFIVIVLMFIALIVIATILAFFMSRGLATLVCMIGAAIFLWIPLKGLWFSYILLLLAATVWSAIYTGRWWDNF